MKKVMKQSTIANLLSYISLLLAVITIVSFVVVVKNNIDLKKSQDDKFNLIKNVNEFCNADSFLVNQARSYAVTGKKMYYDNYFNEINNFKRRDTAKENMLEIGITEEEKAHIDKMALISDHNSSIESLAIDKASRNDLMTAKSLLYGTEYLKGLHSISESQDLFFDAIEIRTDNTIKRLSMLTNISIVVTLICLIVVIFIQIIVAMFVRKKLVKPVLEIKDEMVELSKGNLSHQLSLKEDSSEIGTLVGAINTTVNFQHDIINDIKYLLSEMANGNFKLESGCREKYLGDYTEVLESMRRINERLNETLTKIFVSSQQVSVGSDQVSSGAQSLSQGAGEQAASIEELSSTIMEISDKISDTTKNAQKAKDSVSYVGNELTHGNEKMGDMITAIDEISEKSNEIGKIIKTIDDIAFQTNILALNAAVEAARAGSAGKGFAVVADEVRNLAQKSAEAAKDTTILIEDTVNSVVKGTSIAGETATAIKKVVGNANEAISIVNKIAIACEEESSSVTEVTQGVEQISAVVQTNSATAEESAAAAEELNSQATMLKDLVEQFTLNENLEIN